MEISAVMKKRIEEIISKEKRIDDRGLVESRELEIELGISSKAEGSAQVKLGDTEVLAGIKLDLVEPFKDSPDAGVLTVNAELSPLASDRFESGPPGVKTIELARLIDRGLRNSECIDFKKLCVKEGEKVWSLAVDIYPINDAGNLIDASAIASIAALSVAVFPEVKDDKVQYGELTNKKVPFTNLPITVTVYKVDGKFIIDPTTEEEDASVARVTFTFTYPNEDLHSMQKVGDELSEDELLEMEDIALKEGKKLNARITSILKKA
jgi:exosome complex component RRP42